MLMKMFSLRSYRSLKDEEEVANPYAKSGFYSCCDGVASRPSIATCPPFSSTSLPPTTTIAPLPPPSSSSPKSSSSSSSSSSASGPSSFALQSLRAAWRSLSSLGFSAPRLPHLERAASTPDPSTSGVATPGHPHDYRYTQFPTSGGAPPSAAAVTSAGSQGKRAPSAKDAPPHRSPTPSLAHCLRRRRTKSKSDNALQTVGVRLRSRSDHNIHRVCLVGGSNPLPPPTNAVFSNVQLSSIAVDPLLLRGAATPHHPCQRSRSLERSHRTRVHHSSSSTSSQHTRSLERNHKFRVHLRDAPPDHPAPPPPGVARKDYPPPDGSGGSVSVCSSSSGSGGAVAHGMEGGQGGSFINKPLRGWLHPDQQLADEGICYGVRYIGALEVNTSMKSLNFDTRSLIAKECISKVCEAAGLKTADRKRKVVKSIGRIIGERPLMEHAGSNVTLTITSSALTLTTLEAGQVVASHDMPNISFASGGDPDTLDFIAYVARDNRYGRACFVLECGGGLAQDVITTIGQAFELRFKEYLKRTPATVQYTNVRASSDSASSVNGDCTGTAWSNKYDREYYNDLPGKVPPDLPPPPVPPLPQYSASNRVPSSVSPPPGGQLPHSATGATSDSSSASTALHSKPLAPPAASNFTLPVQAKGNDNLIDLSCDGINPLKSHTATPLTPGGPLPKAEPEYVNDAIIKQSQVMSEQKDPFDMQPFTMQLTQMGGGADIPISNTTNTAVGMVPKALPLSQRLELQREIWYHGPISRKEAEMLLKQDGDFLVRESQATAGQYVLTGIQNGIKKHLLLVNPEGVVRTKSQTFDSVSHLINYHRDNELPIVSAESALVLRNPVPRVHQ